MPLSKQQILKLVNRYIGVNDGYLGNFTYQSHEDFYSEYCGLDDVEIDYQDGFTTRYRFINILGARPPRDQAKILHGVIAKYGEDDDSDPSRIHLRAEVEQWARELEGSPVVATPNPVATSDIVRRALADADALIRSSGSASAVDRVHTSLHGHLKALCAAAGIVPPGPDPSLTVVLKALRENHPKLQATGARADDVKRMLFSMGTALDALNTIRNNATVAHPNEFVLGEPEAMLAINAGRTIFAYVDAKVQS